MNDERTAKDADSTKSTPDAQSADTPTPTAKVAAKKAAAQKSPSSSPLEAAKPAVTARRPISKEEYARTTRESTDHTSVIPVVSDSAVGSMPKPRPGADAKSSSSKPEAKKQAPEKSAPKSDDKASKKPTGTPTKAAAAVTATSASKSADVTTKRAPAADPKKPDGPQTPSSLARAALKKSPTKPAPKTAPEPAPKTAAKPATVSSTADRRAGRRQLRFVDPWSVSKMAFVVSVALMIVGVVAVVVFWFVLQVTGVWQALNDSVANVLSDGSGTFDVTDYLSLGRLTGLALIVSALNVVFMTALATIAAHLYNLAAGLLGGVEVTFEEPS